MKRKFFRYIFITVTLFAGITALLGLKDTGRRNSTLNMSVKVAENNKSYAYPKFYRGLYLSNDSGCAPGRFRSHLDAAVKSHINTLVIDVQTSKYKERMVPAAHVSECLNRGLHPVARIVVFPNGLSSYPPPEGLLLEIMDIAERAAITGFKEIQFDYIRFSDKNRHAVRLKTLSLPDRYRFIESFLSRARKKLDPYGVRIAADIFGRVAHNNNDRIGQKMEVFDKLVDVICPMAYPSHYWSKKLRHDPYGTVLWTSTEADRRTERAEIVTWIQAFKMRHPPGMCLEKYIQHQIKAVHDAKVKGFLLWNARQDYSTALTAVRNFYGARRGGGKYAI